MKNKIILAQIAFSLLAVSTFIGCDDEEYKEVPVTAVNSLYIPETDKNVVLQPSASASVYFEWEKATARDNGVVYYDILFDKTSGDFSNPVYVCPSDNKGLSTGITITHKILNRIAGYAGIERAETGTLKWTIRSSRGLTQSVSKESRNLIVTRLSGLETPPALFITGEGSEGGSNFTSAVEFFSHNEDEFVIYVKLTAGKEFKYTDNKNSSIANLLHSSGTQLKEGDGSSTVSETGVYRITLDFSAGTSVIEKINKVEFFMCSPSQRVEMNYQSNGTWKGENIVPNFTTPWGDDRYFYYMTINNVAFKLANRNWDSSAPGETSGEYFNIGYFGTDGDQWGYSFKFPSSMRNAPQGSVIVDMILYLNSSKYTNEIVKK